MMMVIWFYLMHVTKLFGRQGLLNTSSVQKVWMSWFLLEILSPLFSQFTQRNAAICLCNQIFILNDLKQMFILKMSVGKSFFSFYIFKWFIKHLKCSSRDVKQIIDIFQKNSEILEMSHVLWNITNSIHFIVRKQ